jgi:hypothetical protein
MGPPETLVTELSAFERSTWRDGPITLLCRTREAA